jgi:hypothetical protein
MPIVIEIAGSSTAMRGSATGFSGSARVSPIVTVRDAGDGDEVARAGALGRDAGRASVRSSSVTLTG